MTILEQVLTGLLWLILGLFICNKANWYKNRIIEEAQLMSCIFTVLCAPVVFVYDFVNRFFIQKWH